MTDTQLSMFESGEDLPLFSNTPQRINESKFFEVEVAKQPHLVRQDALASYREDLEGKSVFLQYLPKKSSRKWQNAVYRPAYTVLAEDDAIALRDQEGWHSYRFVEVPPLVLE